MNNLKFKTFDAKDTTLELKKFKHLDGTPFVVNQEILFTKFTNPKLEIDSTDMIDI